MTVPDLLKENAGLIESLCYKCYSRNKRNTFDLDDLRQEAAIAAINAIKSYDPNKGKLQTYLYRCVNNALVEFIKQNSSSLSISVNAYDYSVAINSLLDKGYDKYTICKKLHITYDKYYEYCKILSSDIINETLMIEPLTKFNIEEYIQLSEQELGLWNLLLEDISLREISAKLEVSEDTARKRVMNLFKRIKANVKKEDINS